MTAEQLRKAIRSGRPFRIATADGRRIRVPHPEFAMLSGTGRILFVAKPRSDEYEAFDVLLITGVEHEGRLPSEPKPG